LTLTVTVKPFHPAQFPRSHRELQAWIREHLELAPGIQSGLLAAIDTVFTRHTQLGQESREEAMQALRAGFAYKIARLELELREKEAIISSISQYFEQLVADLTEKSRRDPKTKLMNFARFTEQFESFLALEQRGRWCAIGLADIARFKSYNDAHGHAVGDRIIERVALLLREQARSEDLVARERCGALSAVLHSRFGGDEFCFLIPRLPGHQKAYAIGERFREAVERHDWTLEDRQLAAQPVRIDVGVVSVRLGSLAERRFAARRLAADLIRRADRLMYEAKADPVSQTRLERVRIRNGELIAIADNPDPPGPEATG
jgi:diguanylate cyclase (GGDEF)-like protein